jgi:acetyl esterase/lipase
MASQQLQTVIQTLKSMTENAPATIQDLRSSFEQMASQSQIADDIKCEPVDAGGVPAEWVVAPGAANDRVLLYLHGGGYVIGSVNTHRDMISRLSRAAGVKALGLNYRLAPEHPFPAAVDDSAAAYRWLLSKGTSPARIAIAGDSAGGGLTLATLVALREAGQPMPAAAVCLSPWVDLEGTGESMTTKAQIDPVVQKEGLVSMAKAYLGDKDPRTPLAAPLYANLAGLPPLLIQVGSAETLLDDSTRITERAKAAGVIASLEVWDDMIHVWQMFASILPEGQQAIERIGKFIREQVN